MENHNNNAPEGFGPVQPEYFTGVAWLKMLLKPMKLLIALSATLDLRRDVEITGILTLVIRFLS